MPKQKCGLLKRGFNKIMILFIMFSNNVVFASDSGPSMPWDNPLQVVERALAGTTAHVVIVISIVLSGLGFAVGEHGSLQRKAMAWIIGGSVATGAASLYSTLQIGGALI